MDIVLLLATWAHEYMGLFVNINRHSTWVCLARAARCMILKKNYKQSKR